MKHEPGKISRVLDKVQNAPTMIGNVIRESRRNKFGKFCSGLSKQQKHQGYRYQPEAEQFLVCSKKDKKMVHLLKMRRLEYFSKLCLHSAGSFQSKSFRLISLISCIRTDVLARYPLHPCQHAYVVGQSTETTLYLLVLFGPIWISTTHRTLPDPCSISGLQDYLIWCIKG